MPRVKMAVARERKARVLATLYVHGADREAVNLSIRTIAAETGLTFDQVRSAMRALEKEGLVKVVPRRLPNGGTLENAYRVRCPRSGNSLGVEDRHVCSNAGDQKKGVVRAWPE